MSDPDNDTDTEEPAVDGTVESVVLELDRRIDALEAHINGVEPASTAEESDDVPFDEWLAWFRETFSVKEVTDAWEDVPGVPEELRALHAGWVGTHTEDGKPEIGLAVMYWHEGRTKCQERIADLYSRWRKGKMTTAL